MSVGDVIGASVSGDGKEAWPRERARSWMGVVDRSRRLAGGVRLWQWFTG